MQVFVIGKVLNTFEILDKRRLNKQKIECKQIMNAIDGISSAWKNHPIVKSYTPYRKWLDVYYWLIEEYTSNNSDLLMMLHYNKWLWENRPIFHTEEYFNQMKRRLYTKDNKLYSLYSELGESDINWYYVDNEWLYYENGKRLRI